MPLCRKPLPKSSKYAMYAHHLCLRARGHDGRCAEFPYLRHLAEFAPRVRKKIIRDSTMTTGASWKSEDAGPNRIPRWVMLLPDTELRKLDIDMAKFKPQVIAKLREKAAPYDDCMAVARKLTSLAYGMSRAPTAPDDVLQELHDFGYPIARASTCCFICADPLAFALFDQAQRGKAEIETSHGDPRHHTAANVGFAHRVCNIAQGNRTLDEFYEWITQILKNRPGAAG